MNTTLNEIRKHNPCSYGWRKLLTYLGKTESDNEPLAFATILESNGVLDAIWCFRVLPDYDLKVMEFKLRCARRVENLDKSGSAKKCLDVVEKFIKGEASEKELSAYAAAAYAAAAYATYADGSITAGAAADAAAAAADAAYAAAYAAAAYAADAYAAAAYAAYADADAAYAAYAAAAAEREYQTAIFREIFAST